MRKFETIAGDVLEGSNILVVEDEPFIAFDIADTIEASGGNVVGPAMTINRALKLIDEHRIDAAILDVNLPDGDIGPVIAALADLGIFLIVHTGAGITPELSRAYPQLRVFSKPTPPPLLAMEIANSLRGNGSIGQR